MQNFFFYYGLLLTYIIVVFALSATLNRTNTRTPQSNFKKSFLISAPLLIFFGSMTPLRIELFLFLILTLICVSFVLFQIVNLLTTSIRLKILNTVYRHKSDRNSIKVSYSANHLLRARIQRLVQLKQIRETNDEIVIDSALFLRLSRPVFFLRKLMKLDGEVTIARLSKN